MRPLFPISLLLCLMLCFACADYTPKPRGYMRIEPGMPSYTVLSLDDLPYQFHVSQLTTVELPPVGSPQGWVNIAYPSLNARIYCSYLSITPDRLGEVEKETLSLLSRQSRAAGLQEQIYENTQDQVYGSLFVLEGEAVSPIQFMLTDSASHFFRGALYYEMRPNVDSLAPVTRYLEEDIVELIQTFRWKN